MQLPRGFGPYTLLRRIAVGGTAEIYVAKTAGLGGFEKLVALKLVHPHLSADPHFVRMLVDEAKILVLLTHANVAQVFDLGCIDDTYFIAMEFVEGLDVHGLQKAAAKAAEELPVPVCCYLVAEMLNGLDHAHRKRDASGRPLNIVHRDVSPQNVLISHAGEVKLVDFGIAKTSLRVEGTEVGVIKGKYYYMSPEQAWADPIDRRSDVFSTGILLYEMLTGRMLYSARSIPELIGKVRAAEIVPPTVLRPELPEKLSQIVMKALEREPGARFQNALDFGEALRDYLYESAPAFNASRLAQYVARLLEAAARVDGDAKSADTTDGLRVLTRDEVVHTENSVIFPLPGPPKDTQAPEGRAQRLNRNAQAKAASAPYGEAFPPPPPPPPRISAWPLEEDAEPPTERVRGGLIPGNSRPPLSGSGASAAPQALPTGAPWTQGRLPAFSMVPAPPGDAASARPRAPSGSFRAPLPVPPNDVQEPTGQHRPRHLVAASRDNLSALGPQGPLSMPPPVSMQPSLGLPGARLPSMRVPPPPGFRTGKVPTPALMPPPGDPYSMAPIPPSPLLPDFGHDSGAFRKRSRLWVPALVLVLVTACCLLAFKLTAGPKKMPQLEITSVPSGARVQVDGTEQVGFTPMRITGLEEGRTYALRVVAPGFLPWEATYRTTPGAVQHIAVLQRITGELQVVSTPQAATVYLDDVAIGRTPLTVSSLSLDRMYSVRIAYAGYAEAKREITITEKQLKRIERFTLTQPLRR